MVMFNVMLMIQNGIDYKTNIASKTCTNNLQKNLYYEMKLSYITNNNNVMLWKIIHISYIVIQQHL